MRETILNRIKIKGGLYGRAAEMYMNDNEKADLFINECAEQCHHRIAKDYWGEELVADIISYCKIQIIKKELVPIPHIKIN